MAEANKARHAFGSEANVDAALAAGAIDAYDILFLDEKKIGWIDKNGQKVIVEDKEQIVRVDELPVANGDPNVLYIYNNLGYIWDSVQSKCVPVAESTDVSELEKSVDELKTEFVEYKNHTHSLSDIDELEKNIVRNTFFEETFVAFSTDYYCDTPCQLYEVENKELIVTINDIEYNTKCLFYMNDGSYIINCGDYVISQNVTDNFIIFSPAVQGTEYHIKIESVEKSVTIPDKYIPDLADKVPKKDYAPETKTESMTQPVGKDENGKLWTTVPEKVSEFENDAGYLTSHQDISGKVDKVDGKGLSTHDYDNAAKAKVDAIPEDPKYTDTVYDDTEVKQGLNQLKGDIVDLEDSVITVEKTPNMVDDDTSTWVQGTPDGVFGFCVMTNAIDVSENKKIMLGWNSPLPYTIENVRLWHFDSNMTKIGNSYPAKETVITLDDDVKYVKVGLATGGTSLNPSMIDCKTLGLWLVYGSIPLSSWEPYEINHNNIEENRENISRNTISINTLFDLIVNGGNLLSLDSFNTINEDRYESGKKYTFLNSFKKAFSFEKGILTTPHSTSGTKFAIFADTQFDEGNPTSTFWKTSGTVGDYKNAVNTFKHLDTLDLDFASILGDVINDGYQSDLQYVQLSIFEEIVKNIKNYPLMTYRGNHDPKVSRFSNRGLISCNGVNLWFAQADYIGDAHHSVGTMTLDYISWLESEISKHSDEINIVCGHYPINTDEFPMLDDFTDDSGTERHGHRAEFVSMLNRVGVKLYLSGHLHHTTWKTYTKDGITNIDCGAGFDSYAICNVSSSGLFTMDVYNTSDNTRKTSISKISVQL